MACYYITVLYLAYQLFILCYQIVAMAKQLSEDDKLRILSAALETEDIRPILAAEKLKRQTLAGLAHHALDDHIITAKEFDKIVQTIEKPKSFPTDPEQRIDSILSGIVNIETKQILTLLINDNPQSTEQLRDCFVDTTGSVWMPKKLGISIREYLLLSMDSVGFVAYSFLQEDLQVCHKVTEAGKRYGQPIASYALDLGRQLDFSFYQLLGRTASTGDNRAPYNRFRILEMLLEKDRRIVDIAEELNVTLTGVSRHLKALQKLDLIEYDSVGPEESGWAFYRWTGGDPESAEAISGQPKLTKDVANWLFRNIGGDYKQITDRLIERGGYRNWERDVLKVDVSRMLSWLKQHVFADSKYQGGLEQSHVSLLPNNKGLVEDFTRKIRNALQDGPELEAMEEIHQQYQGDPDKFRQDAARRLQIYVEVSPGINAKSPEERIGNILVYVGSRGSARPRDIITDLGPGSTNYLSTMIKNGLLVKQKGGRAVIYEVNPGYKPS